MAELKTGQVCSGMGSPQPSRRRGLRKRGSGPRRRRRSGEDEGSDRDTSEEDRVNGREENIVNVQIGAPPNPPDRKSVV